MACLMHSEEVTETAARAALAASGNSVIAQWLLAS